MSPITIDMLTRENRKQDFHTTTYSLLPSENGGTNEKTLLSHVRLPHNKKISEPLIITIQALD
jgi:hypothetical protein